MLRPIALAISAAAIGLSVPVLGVQPGDSQVNVTWKAPSSPVDYVVVEQSTNGGATWKTINTLPGNATHVLVDGLQNNTSYWFRAHWLVKGIPSGQSQAIVATPSGAPTTPDNLISIAGDSQISLQWDPAPAKDRVTSYAIEMSSDGGTSWKVIDKDTGSPVNSYLVDGLTNGNTYSFQVAAIAYNGIQSDWSDPAQSVVGVMRDDAFALNGDVTGSDVNLTWVEPDFKSQIDTYRIEISTDGGSTWSTAGEVDGSTFQKTLKYVIGGALYRIIATSINGEFAISTVELVQNLADSQDSPIDQTAAQANSSSNGAAGNGGTNGGANGAGTAGGGSAVAGGVTTTVNGGIGSRETLPKFDIAKNPKTAEGAFVAALALLGLISGGGAVALARREDEAASLENVDYDNPESFDDLEQQGDRSRTWRWPSIAWTLRAEKVTHEIASHTNRISPLMGRVFADGSYLRAMYGSMALLTWICAILFGVLTVLQTGGQALPPQPIIVIALLLIGILDAGAAVLAVVIVALGTAVLGGFDSIPAVRTTLGLALLWFAPSLIASATRPLRRKPPMVDEMEEEEAATELQKFQWERAGDFILAPLLTAFAVRNMINGLPALAGLSLPLVNSANLIAILAAIFVAVRFGMEDSATKNYPVRLALVERNEMRTQIKGQELISVLMRVALFIFVAFPFMGGTWQLWVGVVTFILPTLLQAFVPNLPKFPMLYKIIPAGFPKFVLMLVIGAVYSAWLSGSFKGANAVPMAFILLSIPSFIFNMMSIVEGTPDEDEVRWYMRDSMKWVYRIGAIFLTLITCYLTLR